MTTPEIIFAALAACAPIVSVFIAWLAFRQKKDTSIKDEGKELGSMKSDIAYIKAGIDDLKANDKAKDERLDKMGDALIRVEERLDSHIQNKNIHYYIKKTSKGRTLIMDVKSLVTIIVLGVLLLISLVGLLVALFNGSMKKFIVEKMAEADSHEDWSSEQKRNYVIEAFKEKYKIMEFLCNVQKFIELVIKYSKQINYKK